MEGSTGKIILKTALIATAVVLCAVVLIAVIVFLCFPYEGYKFADNMGMDRLALRFAENYEDDGNIDGLVYCIDKADKLLIKTGNVTFAKRLIGYTEKFFTYDDVEAYFAQLDEYYNAEAPDIRVRVGLYSYMDHIISTNYKARTIVGGGEDDSMIYNGTVTKLSEILDGDLTLTERTYVFSALNKQLLLGKTVLVSIAEDGTKEKGECYDAVLDNVARQFGALYDSETVGMERFYILHRLYYFLSGIREYLGGSELASDWDIFLDKETYPVDGMSIGEAYDQLFEQLNKGESGQ